MKSSFVLFWLGVLSFLIPLTEISSQTSFSSKTDFTAGTQTYCIASGDLNFDGKPDLAAVNFADNTVSIFFNTTSAGATVPSYSAKYDFTTGTNPRSVMLKDINGDGKKDVVVVNSGASSVSVLINSTSAGASSPSLSAKYDFTCGSNPRYCDIADFNGDCKPDLCITNFSDNNVSVLFNTTTAAASTPTFSAAVNFALGTGPYYVTSVDFNGDGRPDIAAANSGTDNISVLINTTALAAATPSFGIKTDFTSGTTPYSLYALDMNGDGKPDLISGNYGANSVSILINTTSPGAAAPTFASKYDVNGNKPSCASVSDVNNDGKQDLIIANITANTLSVLFNTTPPGNSTPAFASAEEYSSGSSPMNAVICDVNFDGRPDIASANYSGNSISVLMNTLSLGNFTALFSSATTFSTLSGPSYTCSADFNMDGLPDLACSDETSNKISAFINTTAPGSLTPSFGARTDFTMGVAPLVLIPNDYNLDGKPDIACISRTDGKVSVFVNRTTPGASTAYFQFKEDYTTGTAPVDLCAADFNMDGKIDLATANYNYNGSISVLLNRQTPGFYYPFFGAKTDLTSSSYPQGICAGDFNGDSKPDIACTHGNVGGPVTIFINNTTPGTLVTSFAAGVNFYEAMNPWGICADDFNNDGLTDLAFTYNPLDNIAVMINTTTPGSSTPTFSSRVDFTSGSVPIQICSEDLNGDGKKDLICANKFSNSVSVFFNKTTAGSSVPDFSSNVEFGSGSYPVGLCTADFNKDGKKDFAAANSASDNVSVLLNNIVLPVELSSFTSNVNGSNVTLNWSTVQEENNKGFEIERSYSGAGWKKIGYAEGKGTTNQSQNYSFNDNALPTGAYSYRLKQIDYNGNFEYHELTSEVIIGVPSKFSLAQNYPNPFNPSTVISFHLPVAGFVSLKVFDMSGREVSSLVNEVKDAGYYSVQFDARNLSSGMYFYKLTSADFTQTKKMILIK